MKYITTIIASIILLAPVTASAQTWYPQYINTTSPSYFSTYQTPTVYTQNTVQTPQISFINRTNPFFSTQVSTLPYSPYHYNQFGSTVNYAAVPANYVSPYTNLNYYYNQWPYTLNQGTNVQFTSNTAGYGVPRFLGQNYATYTNVNGVTNYYPFTNTNAVPYNIYNSPQRISWQSAETKILSGDVASITEYNSGLLTLTMKGAGQTRYDAFAPYNGFASETLRRCGTVCSNTFLALE